MIRGCRKPDIEKSRQHNFIHMKKYFFIGLVIFIVPAQLLAQSAGVLHNKMMGKLISGEITSSNSIKSYIDKMYISETGSPSLVTNEFCNNVRNNLVLTDPVQSLTNLSSAGIVNTEVSNFVKSIYLYFKKYENSEQELSTVNYELVIDSISNAATLSTTARQTTNQLVSILKSSYQFQLDLSGADNGALIPYKPIIGIGGPNATDYTLNTIKCRGFWRKFCIVIWDVIGGAFGAALCALIGPEACPFTISFFAALFSYASSCCGVCCPATYGCINSNICCVCFGQYCN